MNLSQDPLNTLGNGIVKTKNFSFHLVLIIAILISLALLPFIKIDISSQSQDIVCSTTDNIPLTSLVNGKVTVVNLNNNRVVNKDDSPVELT